MGGGGVGEKKSTICKYLLHFWVSVYVMNPIVRFSRAEPHIHFNVKLFQCYQLSLSLWSQLPSMDQI